MGCLGPVGMGVELSPALCTFCQHFHTETGTAQCPVLYHLQDFILAHIRGGVCDQGLDGFLYEMNVITKVLNPQRGQRLALINLTTSV